MGNFFDIIGTNRHLFYRIALLSAPSPKLVVSQSHTVAGTIGIRINYLRLSAVMVFFS